MAEPNMTGQLLDVKEVTSALISEVSQEMGDKIYLLMTLSKILLIVLIVYFIIMIISKLYKIRDSLNLKRIANGVESINQKLDSMNKKKKKG